MKSPETVTRVETEIIPKYYPKLKIVEVTPPNNCVEPLPTTPDDIRTADKLISYLNAEYRLKYRACLDSMQ